MTSSQSIVDRYMNLSFNQELTIFYQEDEAAEKAIVKAYEFCKEKLKKLESRENLAYYKIEIKSSDETVLATGN
jgi:hypothetical protein